jgi:hypothetical protein
MTSPIDPTPFHERMQPSHHEHGFRMDGYWVWCGSVVKGPDGQYHMFASRWPKKHPFFQGYLAASEVVRAVADRPEGPYTFAEVVLPRRAESFWDAKMTHNPNIVPYGDEYLLFYIGATYEGDTPTAEAMHRRRAQPGGNGDIFPWYTDIRIGMARAPSPLGPWQRPDTPTLDITPDGWDHRVVTNPCPCVGPDQQLYLYYRSGHAKLGLAIADTPDAPFVKYGQQPVVDPGEGRRIEDPCVFWAENQFQMVCKDLTGEITGEFHAAVHLLSDNDIDWQPAPTIKAWSRTLSWADGTTTTQASIERPYVFFENNQATWLFAATADGPGPGDKRPGHYFAENTWNMAIPLTTPSRSS